MARPSLMKVQKRLAMAVFKCGREKAWLDPSATAEIAKATTRESQLGCTCE